MLLGVMLLYVGAVLVVNGIWLVGQARAAQFETAPHERARGDVGGTAPVAGAAVSADAHPTFIQDREVSVLNVFTGFVGLVAFVTLAVQGNRAGDLTSVRGGGFILLFAFTYLWVAANIFLNAGGRAFGWYCLFVAITAVPAGIYTLNDANGETFSVWLGLSWFAWAVLWFMFFLLLALDRPIGRLAGWAAIVIGIATAWVFGFLILEGTVKVPG
jgi:putative amide transporter protein